MELQQQTTHIPYNRVYPACPERIISVSEKRTKNHRVSLSCQPIASKFIHLHPRNSSQIGYENGTGKTQTSSISSNFLIDSSSIFSPESDAIPFFIEIRNWICCTQCSRVRAPHQSKLSHLNGVWPRFPLRSVPFRVINSLDCVITRNPDKDMIRWGPPPGWLLFFFFFFPFL